MSDEHAEEEIFNLLDLAVALAESWRLIIIGTILVAGLTYGLASLGTKTTLETATVSVDLSFTSASQLLRPEFLERVASRMDTASDQSSVALIRSMILVSRPAGEQTDIVVTSSSPGTAKKVTEAILDSLEYAVGSDPRRLALEQQITYYEEGLSSYSYDLSEIQESLATTANSLGEQLETSGKEELALSIRDRISWLGLSLIDARAALSGLPQGKLVAPIIYSSRTTGARAGLLSILAGAFALLCFGVLAVLRMLFREIAARPESSTKLERIQRAFGRKTA